MKEIDVIRYYSHKLAYYSYTDLFVRHYKQKRGGYVDLAHHMSFNFKEWLKHDSKVVRFMNDYDELEVMADESQKWHCLIAWYAYLEYMGKLDFDAKPSIFQLKIICPELRLWLVEASELSDDKKRMFYYVCLYYVYDRRKHLKLYNKIWRQYVKNIKNGIIKN